MAHRPRWFQLSLRTLFLALTLLTVLVGGYVVRERAAARKQKAAIDRLDGLGAEVYARPKWTFSLLEPGAPGNVVGLALRSPQHVTDDSLPALADLSQLVWLDLPETRITSAGLVHLSGLRKLERLRLDETPITDAGLVHLATLPRLHTLNLCQTQVTDAGLAHLQRLPSLREVYLQKTSVTDAGIQRLRKARPDLTIDR